MKSREMFNQDSGVLAIANHGFPSWPSLTADLETVDSRTKDSHDLVSRTLSEASQLRTTAFSQGLANSNFGHAKIPSTRVKSQESFFINSDEKVQNERSALLLFRKFLNEKDANRLINSCRKFIDHYREIYGVIYSKDLSFSESDNSLCLDGKIRLPTRFREGNDHSADEIGDSGEVEDSVRLKLITPTLYETKDTILLAEHHNKIAYRRQNIDSPFGKFSGLITPVFLDYGKRFLT